MILDWLLGSNSNSSDNGLSNEEQLASYLLDGILFSDLKCDVEELSEEQFDACVDLGEMAYGEDWLAD